MIPLKLKIEDFLSYRRAEIDFTPHDVLCLTGSNGMGKSTILDAITWGLFGAARGCEGGQNQDRLIRDGAERATVDLAFELGGQTYRIVRSRSRTGRADLQFLLRGDESWTSVAGESLKDTETRIGSALRMDYKTFTASAFLLQGRADDFLSRMKPEERREVFARLLDLGTYERLEESARQSARDAETRRKALAAQIERLSPCVAERDAAQAELEAAEALRKDAAAAVATALTELEGRLAELARLEAGLAQVERERDALAALAARTQAARAMLEAKDAELVRIDALLDKRDEVRAALAEASALSQRDWALREAARRHAELSARRAEVAERIESARHHARARVAEHIERAERLEAQARELERSAARLGELDQLLVEASEVDDSLEELRSQLDALREEHATLRAEQTSLAAKDEELGERLALVARGEGTCPVCEGPLTAEHRKKLGRSISDERSRLTTAAKSAEARQKEVSKEGLRLSEEEKRFKVVVSQRARLVQEAERLRVSVERVPVLVQEAADLREAGAAAQAAIDSGTLAGEWAAELADLETGLQSLQYDGTEHERVRVRMEELTGYRELAGRIEEAATLRSNLLGEREELTSRIDTEATELAVRCADLSALEQALSDADAVRTAAETARRTAAQRRVAEDEAARTCARLSERIESLDRAIIELEAARDAERSAAGEHRTYARLAQAFGRGGIPDLIVENALPELTADANELLGRLTDYEMSVQFAMDRLTKSGKVKETFDVLVHHDGGVRDYQMFSGGEAFRIAFAIRMALSKLLVRRAGARLETLVVDEGFGTQDTEGRERLVEAINLARREFAKVIVITHLDELKDVFGTQVQVTKDAERGSVLRVETP